MRRTALMALAGAAVVGLSLPALAAKPARQVETFDAGTWAALQAGLKQPAAVVFTTTDCVHCPVVIHQLAERLKPGRDKATLIAVVMDQAPGDNDAGLLADAHYTPARRLFAFDGQAPLIRHGIDPQWRGVTPYVVFLGPGQPPRRVTGPPSADDVAAWLNAATKPDTKPAR